MAAHLQGLKGIYWGQTVPLTGPETTIGREKTNTIACDGDSSVSRQHARITESGGAYVLEDLGSSNGTLLNGAKITGPSTLKSGDEIRFGGQHFRFEVEAVYAPSIPPAPSRPREVSRGEQAQQGYTRGNERIYGGQSDMPGCAMPQFNLPDLSGCLRVLLLLLIAFVVIAVIAGLLMLLSSGLGALGGGAAAPGGGSGSSGGGAPPPPQSGGGNNGGGQSEDSQTGIHIKSIRFEPRSDGPSRIFVVWDNLTKGAVHKIVGRLTAMDAQGNLLSHNDVVIYDGVAVPAGETHEDTTGIRAPVDFGSKPADIKIEVTNYE